MGVLKISDGVGSFQLTLAGESQVLAIQINEHVGKSDGRSGVAPYEPGAGVAIVEVSVAEESKWGDSGYTVSQLAADSSVESISKMLESVEGYKKILVENKDQKSIDNIEFLVKQIRDTYNKYTSRNARIEVSWRVQSQEVKVFGAVVDTKTANLALKVYAKIVRFISPAEWDQAALFMKNAALQKRPITINFA